VDGEITDFNAATGELTFTPNGDFTGETSFTFTVKDSTDRVSPAATVTIDVMEDNADDPIANGQSVTTPEGEAVPITLTGSDPDNPDEKLTFAIVDGEITDFNAATGELTFTPNGDFTGETSFTFTVKDSTDRVSPAATVTINVTEDNADRPEADDQTVTTLEDTPIGITLTGSDPDNPNEDLEFAIGDEPLDGEITDFNAATGELTFTPAVNFWGTTTFTFTVEDSTGRVSQSAATVTMNVTEDDTYAPVADAQTVEMLEDTSEIITLTGSDPDNPDETLTFAIKKGPANGTITDFNAATGELTFTPAVNFWSTTTFTFTVKDSTGKVSQPATVTIKVEPVEDVPIAKDLLVEVDMDGDVLIELEAIGMVFDDVLGKYKDVDGDILLFLLLSGASHGGITFLEVEKAPFGNTILYVPDEGFSGEDSFIYQVFDGKNVSNVATVTINVTEDDNDPMPPLAPVPLISQAAQLGRSPGFFDDDDEDAFEGARERGVTQAELAESGVQVDQQGPQIGVFELIVTSEGVQLHLKTDEPAMVWIEFPELQKSVQSQRYDLEHFLLMVELPEGMLSFKYRTRARDRAGNQTILEGSFTGAVKDGE